MSIVNPSIRPYESTKTPDDMEVSKRKKNK